MDVSFIKTTAFKLTVPAVLIIAVGAWLTLSKIQSDVRAQAGSSLTTIVNTIQQAVDTWFNENQSEVLHWASTKEVRDLSTKLFNTPRTKAALLASPAQARLRDWFSPITSNKGYLGYFIVGPENINLSSSRDENLGIVNLLAAQPEFLNKVWSGETALSLPQPSDVPLPYVSGKLEDAVPTMFVGAPIKNSSGKVFSILLFRIDPSAHFTAIFQRARMGQSGESYAFDSLGRLISESRFDDHLHKIGLIADGERGILNIQIRDPKANMLLGERASIPRDQQPLTFMAKSAVAGDRGMNIDGYRDYRGVPVIGAWLWDEVLGFGISSEIDIAEVDKFQFVTRVIFLFFVALTVVTVIMLAYLFERHRRQLAKAKDEAEAASRAKSTFLSSMSHELRTPMNAIMGYGQLLTSDPDAPLSSSQKESVEEILAGGGKLLSLIENVLLFTDITDGKIFTSPEAVGVREMVEGCTQLFRADAESRGIKLVNELPGGDLPEIYIDPDYGRAILKNFLSNAVQYNREDGSITIKLLPAEEKRLRIMVTDTGQGIPEAYWGDVFLPFHRFNMESSSISGTGVGLAIAKSLAESMGGKVGFESEEGTGSTFWVDFPLAQSGSLS